MCADAQDDGVSHSGRMARERSALIALATLAAGSASGGTALGQDLEPRTYSNIPVGMNFVLGGYGYTEGGLHTDPTVPLTDAHLVGHTMVIAYARSFALLGSSAKFDAVVPYSRLSGRARYAGEPVDRKVSGFNDPRFRLAWNFVGAPALGAEEFARYRQDLVIGASIQVSVPVGQYDSSRLVNLGSNRWFVKPEIGISKRWGPLTVELSPSATFFTTNDDFFGGMRREQDPIYAVQGHVIHDFGGGYWGSVNATYYTGGRTRLDGVAKDDLQRNWRVGATFSMPIDAHHSIKLYASTGVSTRTGSDFDAVGLVWQHRW